MSAKDVGQYQKVAAAYGNIAPVIVSAPKNGEHMILAGSARLEACAQAGIREIPAVMSPSRDEAEQLKLALMLSALRDEGGALSEGELIARLINEYGAAPRELCNLLGRSKAWISARMGLAKNLTGAVKAMVTDGTLCPRSAEEVAKLPEDVQAGFAVNAVNAGLSKNEVNQLVQLYKSTHSDDVKREVIESPLAALSKIGVLKRKRPLPAAGLNTPGKQLQSAANYAAQMLLKAVNMAENADAEALCAAGRQLSLLRDAAEETTLTLNRLTADVYTGTHVLPGKLVLPGEQTGGGRE
jgi:ParB-like chromosome segregation protein Spo0J